MQKFNLKTRDTDVFQKGENFLVFSDVEIRELIVKVDIVSDSGEEHVHLVVPLGEVVHDDLDAAGGEEPVASVTASKTTMQDVLENALLHII